MSRGRLLLASALAGILVLAGGLTYALWLRGEEPQLATMAPQLPTTVPIATRVPELPTSIAVSSPSISTPSPTPPGAVAAETVEPTQTLAPAVSTFVIASGDSSSTFVIQKRVLGFASTAVATAGDVTGQFHVSAAGLAESADSWFQLDMRNLSSSDALVNRFIASGAFDTQNFPFARFEAETTTPFPPVYGTGEEFSFSLSGTLTMNGTTRPVTFQVLARQAGEFFSATADADVALSQFNIQVPDLGVGSADDIVHVQFVLVAQIA